MTTETDRMARAGNYVLGLMDDADRERAERDLEIDPAFRDTVVRIAERMHMFDLDPSPEKVSDDPWKTIAARIAGMPQMRQAAPADATNAPPSPSATDGQPHRAASDRRRIMIVGMLIAMFAVGYLAGTVSADLWR